MIAPCPSVMFYVIIVTDGGESVRLFLQPLHLRRVALLILLGWLVPFIGGIGVNIIFAGVRTAGGFQSRKTIARIKVDTVKEKNGQREKGDKEVVARVEPSNSKEKAAPEPPVKIDSKTTENNYSNRQITRPRFLNTQNTADIEAAQRYKSGQPPTLNNTSPAKVQKPAPSQGDLNLLARVIHAEARGEPFEGQVAVGAVLLNRLKSPRFPNNLWGVIFKEGEFCTVRDGQVWLRPDATAYRAAQLALKGWDPTYGALYFYNPAKTTSRWIWSRPVTTKIGNHIFAM